jgi:hypothetical protein
MHILNKFITACAVVKAGMPGLSARQSVVDDAGVRRSMLKSCMGVIASTLCHVLSHNLLLAKSLEVLIVI